MILENINFDSSSDYIYLERYVNNGSPSGFDEKFPTSLPTKAKGCNPEFYVGGLKFSSAVKIHEFGIKPDFLGDWDLLVHPDMLYDRNNNNFLDQCIEYDLTALRVTPTASQRTVKILNESEWFLKLHYKGLIGRVDRSIGINQATTALEVSEVICRAIDNHVTSGFFFFMRETFARVIEITDGEHVQEWGMVFRQPKPYPARNEKEYCIPAFSLFANDMHRPNDPSILRQLIDRQIKKPEDYLFENIISGIYDSYFKLLIKCGIGLECHAQNTLFVINDELDIVGMVAKDAESIDKDISLMDDLGIPYNFSSMNYKCRHRSSYKYHIMHSFFFDYKLGEYLISPIIEHAHQHYDFNKDTLVEKIREFNRAYIDQLPEDFFPSDGKWYTNAAVIHDRSGEIVQEYIANDYPKYR